MSNRFDKLDVDDVFCLIDQFLYELKPKEYGIIYLKDKNDKILSKEFIVLDKAKKRIAKKIVKGFIR